tara:strand:- start:1150 stop:2556 length:1407 start_codon:yes stop_codon:yes gene_type:complete
LLHRVELFYKKHKQKKEVGKNKMTPRRFLLPVLSLIILCQFLSSNLLSSKIFHPKSFQLSNGLQVVLITNRRAPVVSQMIWYKVGAADEPPGKSGLAHFLEHLMFKGTRSILPGDFSRIVSRNGGRDNAFTGQDYTAYFQEVSRRKLELVMSLEAGRMRGLLLTDKEFRAERDVVLEERSSRTDNKPASQLWEAARAALFFNHPYRNPVIGWKHEIKDITIKDVRAFYNRYYIPNNAILIIAGDVTIQELKPLAEKYYGVIPRGADITRNRSKEPGILAERRVEISDKRVGLPSITITFRAPSYASAKDNRAYALEVLAEILGGGATSNLYRDLVVQEKLASSATAWASCDALDYGTFGIFAAPRSGISVSEVESRLKKIIQDVIKFGISEKSLVRAVNSMVANSIYARDSLNSGPNIIGQALSTGLKISDVESWPDRIKAITIDQVNKVAKEILQPENSVTAILRRD